MLKQAWLVTHAKLFPNLMNRAEEVIRKATSSLAANALGKSVSETIYVDNNNIVSLLVIKCGGIFPIIALMKSRGESSYLGGHFRK